MDDALVLRDLHPSVAPPWWPPAPGWWWLAAVVVLALAGLVAWRVWRARRRRRFLALFDGEVDAAKDLSAQVAAMSALLRRAARQRDPAAAHLEGQAWLAFLDEGCPEPRFTGPEGRLLLEGPFRPGLVAAEVEALRTRARARFIEWMDGRP